jgi:hypothetical protein
MKKNHRPTYRLFSQKFISDQTQKLIKPQTKNKQIKNKNNQTKKQNNRARKNKN